MNTFDRIIGVSLSKTIKLNFCISSRVKHVLSNDSKVENTATKIIASAMG